MAYDFPNSPTVGQIFQGWSWDGEKWLQTLAVPNAGGVVGVQVFTQSGTYTPSASMTTCVIECVGGGGGGGGATAVANVFGGGGGGGGGGYSRKMITAAQVGASQTVTIGGAGTGGAAANGNGGNGGATSVGALCVANGGQGGTGGINTNGGLGGAAGTGDFTIVGGSGGAPYSGTIGTVNTRCASGGISMFGGPGPSNIASGGAVAGTVAVGYGGGGGGAGACNSTASAAGAAGTPGLVIITEYGITTLGSAATTAGAVRFDVAQGLTSNQMAQARANIAVQKKNYILNGAMMVSQELGTAGSGGVSNVYGVDQFGFVYSNASVPAIQQVPVPTPGGSPNRLRIAIQTADATVAAADYAVLFQPLEGLRVADLRLGTAAAKTFTIQFGVKAPAGTYCMTVTNAAPNRSYVAEYVIAAGEANTDVVKSVTIPGDVTGTWATDNTRGLNIVWGLMCGSNFQQTANSWGTGNVFGTANQFNFVGQTAFPFELFDVGLYEGNVAPPFVVPDYPSELALCKRYFHKVPVVIETPTLYQSWAFPVEMRANPTITGGGAGFVNQIPSISSCIASQTTRAVATLTFNARL